MSRVVLLILLCRWAMAMFARNGTDHGLNPVFDAMIDILRTCPRVQTNGKLLLSGEYDEFLKERREFFNDATLGLIADAKFSAQKEYTLTQYVYFNYQSFGQWQLVNKLHVFVAISSSQPLLRLTMQKILESTWSNTDGLYILVDKRTGSRGCANAGPFLRTAWQYNTLFAIFVCRDPVDGILLYTYNPFSDVAPGAWRKADVFPGRNGHPWTLLKQKYGKVDVATCQTLYFDKTMKVDGYHVRMNAVSVEPTLKIDLNKTGLDRFSGDNAEVIKVLWSILNVTADVNVYNDNINALGSVNDHGIMTNMLAEIGYGKVDVGMNSRVLYSLWRVRETYPHGEGGLCVITRPAGIKSLFTKLMALFSLPYIVGIVLVCALVHVVLARYQGFVAAALNVVRLVVCVSVLQPPAPVSGRIFLCTALLLFLVTNAVFQSHSSSLLTVVAPNRNIDNVEDLKKSGYTIYGARVLKDMMGDPELATRYKVADYHDCKSIVKNTSRTACVGECVHAYQRIQGEYLHRSRKQVRDFSRVFMTRRNWPLFHRVNSLIQRMVEAGLMTFWKRRATAKLRRNWKRRESKRHGYNVLVLQQLAASFFVLLVGSACALGVFLGELAIGKRRARCPVGRAKADSRVAGTAAANGAKTREIAETNANLFPWTP